MPDIYLHLNGQQAGPYQPEQIRQLLGEGKISGETPAWHKDLPGWINVAQVLAQFPEGMPLPPPFVPSTATPIPKKQGMRGCLLAGIICGVVALLVLPCLAGLALPAVQNGMKMAKQNMAMQRSRAIALLMFQYSVDHNGVYPNGKTSTEVFQKLIDEKYISDPTFFYIPMPGKTKATSQTLTAENVCFDVTAGVTKDFPDGLPLVFVTGYSVTYSAGASATPDNDAEPFSGLAVAYKNNSARFIKANPDGTVPNVISPDFNPGAQTYQQLRP